MNLLAVTVCTVTSLMRFAESEKFLLDGIQADR
jgi:hypothetical protein